MFVGIPKKHYEKIDQVRDKKNGMIVMNGIHFNRPNNLVK